MGASVGRVGLGRPYRGHASGFCSASHIAWAAPWSRYATLLDRRRL